MFRDKKKKKKNNNKKNNKEPTKNRVEKRCMHWQLFGFVSRERENKRGIEKEKDNVENKLK